MTHITVFGIPNCDTVKKPVHGWRISKSALIFTISKNKA
jgi:arsenate reductase-like glutaredoxin family protein